MNIPSIYATYILAYNVAHKAHSGQFRRDGKTPYMHHINAVIERTGDSYIDKAVAADHDLIEDKRLTLDELKDLLKGYEGADEVIDGVITLTRRADESYEKFIWRIATYKQGRWVRVKVADILANLSDSPTDSQITKYVQALLVLISSTYAKL